MREGKIFVLSGPSGVGKGTLSKLAFDDDPLMSRSISCTTRGKRQGEREGIDYKFIALETFVSYVKGGQFLEYACVHGTHYYGTLKADVEESLRKGLDVLLEIDVQGARQIREKIPSCVTIFVSPPSIGELEKRLRDRRTETEEDLQLRLKNALDEIQQSSWYDYIVINTEIDRAVADLKDIVQKYRE
jgi:guanylate kinase